MHSDLTREYLELLSALICADTSNPPGKEAAAAAAAADFLGFHLEGSRLLPSDRAIPLICGRVCMLAPERPQLIFTLPGENPEGGLAFTGHLDTVPVDSEERSRWESDPFDPVVRNGKIYGRGSCDMKGGVAAALFAFRQAAESAARGQKPRRNLALILTCDEEGDMRGSELLQSDREISRFTQLIVCEPTGLQLCSSGRGRVYGEITLRGSGGHGSGGTRGNIIQEAARLILRMEKEDFSDCNGRGEKSFWQCLAIHARKDPCVIPDRLDLIWDARLHPDHPCRDIRERLLRLQAERPGFEFRVIDEREGWRLGKESSLRGVILQALRELGLSTGELTFPGTTDGSKLRRCGMEAAVIGPGNLEQAHKENEFLDLEEALKAIELYSLIAKSI